MENVFLSIVPTVKIRIPKEFCKMSLEGGSGETCFQRFPPKPDTWAQNQKWGWKGDFEQPVSIPLTVGVRLLFIIMMGTTHPHLQASEASALGGGNQKYPRNEGGRCERQRAYSPPCVSGGEANEVSLPSPLRFGSETSNYVKVMWNR